MKKQQALDLLRQHISEVRERFGVKRLALFGSTARDEATADSDLDVLVEFEGTADSKRYFGLMFYLEGLFGFSLDWVTNKVVCP